MLHKHQLLLCCLPDKVAAQVLNCTGCYHINRERCQITD